MARSIESPGARLRSLWGRLSGLPGGPWLFSLILGRMVPYTASIRATVVHFEPGHAKVRLRDRRRVRNHLRSVHAVALANVGELSTGLALIGALEPDVRGILTGLEVEYLKKARGVLLAEARCSVPEIGPGVEHRVEAEISDDSGDVVAIATARWKLSPTPNRSKE